MIALVTDSNAQLPSALVDRYRVRVVPLTIVVDGVAHLETPDLERSWFAERLAAGAKMSTAAPSPGQHASLYSDAANAGAEAVLSVHVGAGLSGTVGSARLAAKHSPIPVEVIDSTTASFALGCCVWSAGDALDAGADLATAAAAARATATTVDNVFIVSGLDLARAGGRLETGAAERPGLPVLALRDGRMRTVGAAVDMDGAIEAMLAYVGEAAPDGRPLRVGVGDTDLPGPAAHLADALLGIAGITEVVRYHVGPSVSVHTGTGSLGVVFAPR